MNQRRNLIRLHVSALLKRTLPAVYLNIVCAQTGKSSSVVGDSVHV